MTYLDFLEQKVLLERLVIGLEEPVLIKGLGELSAKIDSGNGGYNVIHGTDFHQQGNELMFTTHDSFGHEKKIQAKVIDTIEVNMGGGNIENRPVIELDIKFAGEDYKKIPFSVSDRSTNTNPILISKGFVENELEALIDVGKKNISNDGIDVVYGESVMLDEGVLGAIGKGAWGLTKGIGKGIGKGAWGLTKGIGKGIGKGAWGLTKGIGKGALGAAKTVTGGNGVLDGIAKFGKWLGGDAKMKDWASPLTNNIKSIFSSKNKNLINQIKEVTNIENEDTVTIRPKTNNLTVFKNIAKDPNADLTNNIVELWNANKIKKQLPICLVTSFMMCKGSASDKKTIKGLEKDRESLKSWITDSKETIDEVKGEKKPNIEEQEEGVPEQPEQATQSQEGVPEQPQQQEQQTQQEGQPQQEQQDDFEEVTTFLEQLCQFTLWFISIEKVKNEAKYQKQFKEYIQSGKFDEILFKMFKSGEMSPKTIEPYVKKLAELFQKDGKQGFFALCWTPQSQSELKDEMKDIKRQTYFYEKLDYVAYQKKASNSPKFDEAEKQIQKEIGIEEPTNDELTDESEGEQEGEVTDEQTDEQTVEEPTDDEQTDESEGEQEGEVTDEQTVEEPTDNGTTDEEVQDDQQQTDQVVDEEPPVTTDTSDEITDTPHVVDEQPIEQEAEPAPQSIQEPQVTEEQPIDTEAPTDEVKEPEKVKPENNKELKEKGENEEDPWIENEEDPWVKSKLKHLKQKGIM